MQFIHVHVHAVGLPIVCVKDNHCESSSVCLPNDSCVPEATAVTLQEERASMCITVIGLLIPCVSEMCQGVAVNQLAICTVTLTLVNHEPNRKLC